jgi:hypothetical protein
MACSGRSLNHQEYQAKFPGRYLTNYTCTAFRAERPPVAIHEILAFPRERLSRAIVAVIIHVQDFLASKESKPGKADLLSRM